MKKSVFLTIVLVFLVVRASVTSGQNTPFGKNKVQYREFQWKYIQSPHFDIYFYDGGKELADFTAEVSEPALASIQKTCHFDITDRITLIIYNSHNDFQQTNAVGEYLPEGVGGVTELLKNRVVVPFEGDYTKFRHVIHHELVHAVLNLMFSGGSYQALLTGGGMQIPTWMNEGLAEYESLEGLDAETDMFMRDAVLADEVPKLERLGGYVQYRVGQTMYTYIAEKYGTEKVGELLNRIKMSRSPELGFRSTFGLGISEFGERFQEYLKKKYFPDIAKYEDPSTFAEVIADHKKLDNFFNSSPEISPSGEYVAFISDRNESFDVWVQNLSNPKDIKRILSGGGSTADFEELHLLAPGLAWSHDGKNVLVVSKSGRYDIVSVINVESGDIERLPVTGLDGIFQLKVSPDGKHVGFIGYKDGASDLYLYEIESKSFKNLTRDVFSDQDICWSADSRSIIFSSDRKTNLIPAEYAVDGVMQAAYQREGWDLYEFNIQTSAIRQLTNTPGINEEKPSIAYDKNVLFFTSDSNGINNIYAYDLTTKIRRPITNSVSRVVQISSSKDAAKLAFAAVNKTGYNIYVMRNPLERIVDSVPLTSFYSDKRVVAMASDSVIAKYASITDDEREQDTIRGYGDISIDLSNYVYSSNPNENRSRIDMREKITDRAPVITDFKDSTGDYIPHNYKVLFSSDLITGTAGYMGYYGLMGSAQMLFSDELGNHQLYFATNLIIDLKNSSYLLAYYNLTDRINYGIQGFHTARFLYTIPDVGYEDTYNYFYSRFTTWGVSALTSYPFDRFTRLDLSFAAQVHSKDVIDDNLDIPTKTKFSLSPTLSYVFDNTSWSYFYPKGGTRYNLSVSAAPGFGSKFIGFFTPAVDVRHYIPLFGGTSLAMRFAGAVSVGPNPQKFYLGGMDGWINSYTSEYAYPITEPEDISFYGVGLPLRGYAYNEKVGTKYILSNIAWRFPFPIFVSGAPLGLFAEAFVDAGTAWDKQLYLFRKKSDGSFITDDLLMSTGIGFRTYFFGFYLKMDIAWRTDLQSSSSPNYLFSIGQDF